MAQLKQILCFLYHFNFNKTFLKVKFPRNMNSQNVYS